jgi:hypothetical protein
MDFNIVADKIKSPLKFIFIVILLLASLAVGFFMAVTLVLIVTIAVPIVRYLERKRSNKYSASTKKNYSYDYIDAEYEIIHNDKNTKDV